MRYAALKLYTLNYHIIRTLNQHGGVTNTPNPIPNLDKNSPKEEEDDLKAERGISGVPCAAAGQLALREQGDVHVHVA